jgi:deoxyribose-phosphate aldolase
MITKEQFAGMQDHSILGPYCPRKDVKGYCEEVIKYGFAAIYVNPCDVAFARSIIADKASVGTVIGFPQGAATTKS